MRSSEPKRRPKPDNPEALDERIAKLVVRILLQAALAAHGRDRVDDVWEDFRQD